MSDARMLGVDDVRGLVGLDRLSLSFPVRDYDPSVFPSRSERRDPLTGELLVENLSCSGVVVVPFRRPESAVEARKRSRRGDAFIGVQYMVGRGFFGKVEANPAPWFADDYEPVPLSRFGDVLDGMSRVLAEHGVVPTGSLEGAKVNRVDFLRTIRRVAQPERTLAGLEGARRKFKPKVALWSNPAQKGAQTLQLHHGSGVVRCYDGHAAYGLDAGTLRWEAQAGQRLLRRFGVERVADLSELRCQALVADRWNWSRMGDVVTGGGALAAVVLRHVSAGGYVDKESGDWQEVSAVKAKRLVGELWMEARGIALGSSNSAAAEYERWKRNLGVVLTSEVLDQAVEEIATRLDYVAGCEVAA